MKPDDIVVVGVFLKDDPDLIAKDVALFEKYGVFSARETKSRYEIYIHTYHQTVSYEGLCGLRIVRTQVLPATYRYLAELAAAKGATSAAAASKEVGKLADAIASEAANLDTGVTAHDSAATLKSLAALRVSIDALELLIPADLWPLPSYAEMRFLM